MKKLALLLWAVFLCSCSNVTSETAGGPGSETTNGIVAMVNGSPASYAGVALRKVNFTVDEFVPENAIVQPDAYADQSGSFTLECESDGKYRLTVVHGGAAFSKVISSSDLSSLDTVVLEPTGSVAGAVEVPEGSDFVWVGVLGMDVMVKSDSAGQFSLPQLPSTDSLKVYFVRNGADSAFNTVAVKPVAYETEFVDLLEKDDGLSRFIAVVEGKPAKYAMMAMRPVDFRVATPLVEYSAVVADYYADSAGIIAFKAPDSGEVRLTVVQSGYGFSKILKASDIAKLDTVELTPMSNMQSKVTLNTFAKYAWVGVKGLDVLVKTDGTGKFSLPLLPAGDTLELYFEKQAFDSVYVTEKVLLNPRLTEFYSPVMVLSNFEEDSLLGDWYFSADKIGSSITYKGETISGKSSDATYPSLRVTKAGAKDSVHGGVFYGKYMLAADDNAWALVGTTFATDSSWNFSELDSISFWAKGKGQVRVAFERWDPYSEMFGSAEKAASGWMDMSSSKWTKFVMKPNDLCFNAQDVANCASSWESIKDHVHQMHVFVRGGNEFYLDDIRLYGALF